MESPPIQIARILVPTDYSDNAAHAYGYAKSLAKAFGATILVAHVSDATHYPVGPDQIPIAWENLSAEIAEYNRKHMLEVRAAFGDFEVETLEREGSAFVEIVRVAREQNVDIIVMATHGHTGVQHLLMGSTAEKVVRKAPCPVLTVHPTDRQFALP